MNVINKEGLLAQSRSIPLRFWLLNVFQMLEKLAYWCVLLQMPIYIAQKDQSGGLQWEQTVKGLIFFWWALVQNITPVFAGGFADRYGYKKTFFISFILIICGYAVLGMQREFYPFLAGTIILGLGSGIFKPTLQGSIASTLNERNSSAGWGIYFMLLNLAVFFGSPFSKYLKEISWQAVFLGSGALFALNFIFLLFLKEKTKTFEIVHDSPLLILKKIVKNFIQPRVYLFIIIMSGFTIIYMQFYETLPNFIYDWTDSTTIVKALHLPAFMTMKTVRGVMISYEWLYNINAGLVIVGVVFVSWYFGRFKITKVLIFGILTSAVGLMLCGVSMFGYVTLGGFIIYTFGEMITNPKFTGYMGAVAPEGEKALYMSYISISWAFGLAGGSLLGGFLYKHIGEKATLAARYLAEYHSIGNVKPAEAMNTIQSITGKNPAEITGMLWNLYSPYMVWVPFIILALAAVFGMIYYSRKIGKQDRGYSL